jgi:hypothetical protein
MSEEKKPLPKLSHERSVEFAAHFEILKHALQLVDWEYAKACVKGMRGQAGFQETIAVLNPSYPLAGNDLIRKQAEALEKFIQGVQLLKECDQDKRSVAADTKTRAKIAGMFL